MIVLGLPSPHHSGWGLIKDGKVVRAIQEERLNRIKHYPYYTDLQKYPMTLGIDYLFNGLEFDISNCDVVTIPSIPRTVKDYDHLDVVAFESVDEVINNNIDPNNDVVLSYIRSKGFSGKVVFVNHQLSHAAYVYNYSGYKSCDVLSYDGSGCGWPPEVVAGFHVDNHSYTKLFSYHVPHSLGHIYSNTTDRIFGPKSDGQEGKTMGLAPYGVPNPNLKMLIQQEDMFVATYPNTTKMPYAGVHPYNSVFGLRQGNIPQRTKGKEWDFDDPSDKAYISLAASAQNSIEEAGMYYARKLKGLTDEENLCLVGGVALNGCLNGLIRRSKIYNSTFAGPASHDGGHGLGAPLYYSNLSNPSPVQKIKDDFLGYSYTVDECKNAAVEFNVDYEEFDSIDSLGIDMAKSIVDQKIVAIFEGASEFGPRALGHRSIVVDPRCPEMKDVLNAKVKFREAYRPFAPFVLKEHALDFFEFDDSEYMLFVAKATERAKREVPAVIHVDDTARMQTVTSDNQPFYNLLNHFYRMTGTPVLLNTSFNVAGEPIVETPQDAIRCFLSTSIDILYLNSLKIKKGDNNESSN